MSPQPKASPANAPVDSAPRKAWAVRFALVLLSACLYAFGYAGFEYWPLSFIALVPLLLAIDGPVRLPVRKAALAGFACGSVANALGYYWLVGMLRDFSGFPFVLCVAIAAIFWLFLGGLCAFFCALYVSARQKGWGAPLAIVLVWVGVEAIYPALFETFYSNSLHNVPVLVQIADLGGPMLVSVVLLTVNAAVFVCARSLWLREPIDKAPPIVALSVLLATVGYGAYRIREVEADVAAAPKITVGLVQANMGIFQKRADPFEGLRRHIDQSLTLEKNVKPDLLVWPESAYTFFLPDHVTNVRRQVVGNLRTPVLFGGLSRREVQGEERHFNTAFITDENGDIRGTYDKTYLLAFGEYLPFGEQLPFLYDLSPHSGHFTKGSHVRALPFRGYKLGTLICYEDILPAFVRKVMRENNPHVLVNITNDAWFGDTIEPWIHLALAQFRSVEHHRYLVRATNSGISAIVDPLGRVVTHSSSFTRENLHGKVAMLEGATVYDYVGDVVGWIGLAFIALMLWTTKPPRVAFRKRTE